MIRWPSSLRARLALWYSLLLGLPLVGLAVACYLVFAGALERRTDEFIGDALTAFTRELGAERRATGDALVAIRSTTTEVRFRDLGIAVLDGSGRPVASSELLPVRGAGGPTRVVIREVRVGGEPFTLRATYSTADVQAMLARIRTIFLVAIPLLLVTASLGGYLLARRSLAPVASMAARAREISAATLGERLPVAGGDELVGLARVVNDLLDRLESAFAQQRRFVADASHELRTPAAILRAEADVTLAREHREEGEYRASLGVMRDASQRLTRIVEELFLLARADAGHLGERREPLHVGDLVNRAARAVQSVAEARAVRVVLTEMAEAPVEGDADLLGRALLNLLDNAIKHAPPGSAVEVALRRGEDSCEVSVVDAGPGIPPGAEEKVFERFFRADTARSRSEAGATSGAGLGLAIARRIAEVHAGRVELTGSRPGRTEFRLTLPLDGAALPPA